MESRARGITASLNRLGIRLTTGQWIGAVAAVLAGLIIARILPFIYPLIFPRLLDLVLGPGISTVRDGLNTWIMSMCTLGTSFVISFATAPTTRDGFSAGAGRAFQNRSSPIGPRPRISPRPSYRARTAGRPTRA